MKRSHHRRVCAVHGTNDAAFGAAVGADVGNFHQHAVAVHRGADKRRRDENVTGKARLQARVESCRIRRDETESVAVHAEAADQRVLSRGRLWKRVAIRIDQRELPCGDHPFKPFRKFTSLCAMQAEFAQQLFVTCHALGLALDFFQDGGIGEHFCLSGYLRCGVGR